MLGFLIGTLCVVGLVRVARRHHAWHHGGWHGRHGGGWRSRGEWSHRPGGFRRHALYALFERLDATPGQEKVISAELDALREKLRGLRNQYQASRKDLAGVVRQEHILDEDVNKVMAGFDAHLDELRKAAGSAMQRVHEALDERQRRILAELIESGPFWSRC